MEAWRRRRRRRRRLCVQNGGKVIRQKMPILLGSSCSVSFFHDLFLLFHLGLNVPIYLSRRSSSSHTYNAPTHTFLIWKLEPGWIHIAISLWKRISNGLVLWLAHAIPKTKCLGSLFRGKKQKPEVVPRLALVITIIQTRLSWDIM